MKKFFLVSFLIPVSLSFSVSWILNGNGDWEVDANWSGTYPNGYGAIARFDQNPGTTPIAVTLNGSDTVGALFFQATGTEYTLQGTGPLIIDNNTPSDVLFQTTGGAKDGVIAVPYQTTSRVNFNLASGTKVKFSGLWSGSGGDFVHSNTGTATFEGTEVNTATNTYILQRGTLELFKTSGGVAINSLLAVTGGTLTTFDGISTYYSNQFNSTNATLQVTGANSLDVDFDQTDQSLYSVYWAATNGTFQSPDTLTLSATGGDAALTMNGGHDVKNLVLTGASGSKIVYLSGISNYLEIEDLDLGPADRTIDVADETIDPDLWISGTISNSSGTAGFTKTGAGNLRIGSGSTSTSNTFNGTVTILAGILETGKPNNYAALSGSDVYVSGGVLNTTSSSNQFNGANTTNLHIQGGTWTNSTLQNLNTLQALTGNITSTANVSLYSTGTALTIRNGFSIGGIVSLEGGSAGTVLMDSSGNATIDTLFLENGKWTINVSNENGTLEINSLDSSTTSSGFNKTGPGELYINGSGTFPVAGTPSLSEGTLYLNGTLLATTLSTSNGTKFYAAGTITSDVSVGGIISPSVDNGIGTVQINGNLEFKEGSILQIDLNPTNQDYISVDGNVTIATPPLLGESLGATPGGATLLIVPNSSYSYPSDYQSTILMCTGTLSGKFSDVINNYPLFQVFPVYTTNSILLLDIYLLPFTTLATGANPLAVAKYLDNQTSPSEGMLELINNLLFSETSEQLDAALNLLHPGHLKGLAVAQEHGAVMIRQSITKRLKEFPSLCCHDFHDSLRRLNVWFDFAGERILQKKQDNHLGFHESNGALTLGADTMIIDNLLIGAAATFSQINVEWDSQQRKHGQSSSGYGSVYLTYTPSFWYLSGVISGAYNYYHEERSIDLEPIIPYSTVKANLKGSYNGSQFLVHGEGGFRFFGCSTQLRPFLSFDYIYMHQSPFFEKGDPTLATVVKGSNYNYLRTELGLGGRACLFSNTIPLVIDGKLSYVREDRFGGGNYKNHLMGGTDTFFKVKGLAPDRNLFSPAIGLSVVTKTISLSSWYEVEVGKHYFEHSLHAGIHKLF